MPRITELYAYVMADKDDDDEAVPMARCGAADYLPVPIMGADYDRVASAREVVKELAERTGKAIRLVRSTGLEVIEVIHP